MNKKRKSKTLIIVAVLAVVVAGIYFAVNSYLVSNLQELTASPLVDVDLTKVSDGTYPGSYKVFPVAAEVKVTVEDHMITRIELVKHNHGQGAAAEIIPEKVVEAQSLNVDTVSGATYSSKVILKAIEDALLSGTR